jgi:hypothetical protein
MVAAANGRLLNEKIVPHQRTNRTANEIPQAANRMDGMVGRGWSLAARIVGAELLVN